MFQDAVKSLGNSLILLGPHFVPDWEAQSSTQPRADGALTEAWFLSAPPYILRATVLLGGLELPCV